MKREERATKEAEEAKFRCCCDCVCGRESNEEEERSTEEEEEEAIQGRCSSNDCDCCCWWWWSGCCCCIFAFFLSKYLCRADSIESSVAFRFKEEEREEDEDEEKEEEENEEDDEEDNETGKETEAEDEDEEEGRRGWPNDEREKKRDKNFISFVLQVRRGRLNQTRLYLYSQSLFRILHPTSLNREGKMKWMVCVKLAGWLLWALLPHHEAGETFIVLLLLLIIITIITLYLPVESLDVCCFDFVQKGLNPNKLDGTNVLHEEMPRVHHLLTHYLHNNRQSDSKGQTYSVGPGPIPFAGCFGLDFLFLCFFVPLPRTTMNAEVRKFQNDRKRKQTEMTAINAARIQSPLTHFGCLSMAARAENGWIFTIISSATFPSLSWSSLLLSASSIFLVFSCCCCCCSWWGRWEQWWCFLSSSSILAFSGSCCSCCCCSWRGHHHHFVTLSFK